MRAARVVRARLPWHVYASRQKLKFLDTFTEGNVNITLNTQCGENARTRSGCGKTRYRTSKQVSDI